MEPRRTDLREHVDGPGADPGVVGDTLRTLARLNAGVLRTHAVLRGHLGPLLRAGTPGPIRVLDWGCGGGDTARALAAAGTRAGCRVEVHGVDLSPAALDLAGRVPVEGVSFSAGDALSGGPDPAGFDLVVSSFLLHHLPDDAAVAALLARGARARRGFVHLDLVRSGAARALFRVLGRPFSGRRETWEDGLTSLRRSFTAGEARALAARAVPGARVEVHFPWRLCVSRVGTR